MRAEYVIIFIVYWIRSDGKSQEFPLNLESKPISTHSKYIIGMYIVHILLLFISNLSVSRFADPTRRFSAKRKWKWKVSYLVKRFGFSFAGKFNNPPSKITWYFAIHVWWSFISKSALSFVALQFCVHFCFSKCNTIYYIVLHCFALFCICMEGITCTGWFISSSAFEIFKWPTRKVNDAWDSFFANVMGLGSSWRTCRVGVFLFFKSNTNYLNNPLEVNPNILAKEWNWFCYLCDKNYFKWKLAYFIIVHWMYMMKSI